MLSYSPYKTIKTCPSFGSVMDKRSYTAPNTDYKYGFNGKEQDKDHEGMGGGGSTYDYGFRIYNPNLGRFLSVDPLTASFPLLTPYQFASNTPISAIDLDGLEAKIAIYGAGIKRAADGTIKEKSHENQFKSEADKDVKAKNATESIAVHTGTKLVETLVEKSSTDGSIEYLSIASHAGSMGIILDNGQYGLEVVGHPNTANWVNSQGETYNSTTISDIANNSDIKWASNALVVFAGCNSGKTNSSNGPIYSVAEDFTEKTGVATIGASGYTAPIGTDGARKADQEFRLFYKDENGVMQQMSLGKELNQTAIDNAKNKVNEIAKKVEEQSKTPAPAPETPQDTTGTN